MAPTISINSLPIDVRQHIYHLVGQQADMGGGPAPGPGLAQYATVSREWQEAFERFTFQTLYLTPRRLKSFVQIVSSPRRKSNVLMISFHVSLGRYDFFLNDMKETEAEQAKNSEMVGAALEAFCRAMACWRKTGASPLGLKLQLVVDSPSDLPIPKERDVGNSHSVLTERARSSYIELDLASLSLPAIDVFSHFRCSGRHIKPTSILAIVSRLLTLTCLDIELSHDTIRDKDIEERTKFAMSLEPLARNVTSLTLRRPAALPTSSAMPRKQTWSAFYTAMRRFSQQCENFEFDDCIDACEFFAPFMGDAAPEISTMSSNPYWDRLKRLRIRNSYMVARPYLRANSRTKALASIQKLLVAVGRALGHMPELRNARICQYLLAEGQLDWSVVTFKCRANKAVLDMRGFTPGLPMVDAWKSSIAGRNVELEIHVDPTESFME
ncbi:hypothetical protein F4779DRAFT_591545 [Xylariaceae sp. FL0662B]|nr:hypothetical protein F4779DRAFT_591545 [Xylariaceae sp. FL0662B]